MPPATGHEGLQRLRTALSRAGYDQAGLARAVFEHGRLTAAEGIAALALRDDADEPLPVLARLFVACEPVDARHAADALAPVAVGELPDVLRVEDGLVRARVKIEPFEDLLIASDAAYDGRETVLGIGSGTQMIAASTVRRPAADALDLCTGSGALALLAARHAERVVGADLGERALRLARLNAVLNGVERIDWRRGDLFEPVGDARFDLVTANPPFVVSPASDFLFRDGGGEDDSLSRDVVAGAASRLREGGFAHLMAGWVAAADGSWSERPRAWVRDCGCDALLLRSSSESPVAYALRWNRLPDATPEEVRSGARTWLEYYRRRGIESLVTGIVVLRRRSGRNWVHHDELVRPPGPEAGAHVERLFAGRDALESLDGERDLLALPLAPAPRAWVVERRLPSGEPEQVRLSVDDGLPIGVRISPACARVVAALDGRSARDAVQSAARDSGESFDALAAECLPQLAGLLGSGLLETRSGAIPARVVGTRTQEGER